jgi:hypothetical protein
VSRAAIEALIEELVSWHRWDSGLSNLLDLAIAQEETV